MPYDISIIRPQIQANDVQLRGEGVSLARQNSIKKALRTLHTLELTATNIYKYQITSEKSELNRHLIMAMCNEMTHYQDFQVKLYEYGSRPNCLRWAYYIVGAVLGCWSRIRGEKAILETGIWVETKAVNHYGQLLKEVEWDDETRRIVEKNQADEDGHIARWRKLLETI